MYMYMATNPSTVHLYINVFKFSWKDFEMILLRNFLYSCFVFVLH